MSEVAEAPSAEPSAPEAPAPEAKQPAAEKFTLKVNGKLRELTREDAMRELQKSVASRENFEKSAELTKKNKALLQALQNKETRRQALGEVGVNIQELIEEELARRAEDSKLSPEQKALKERENRIAELERQARQREEADKSEKQKALDAQVWTKVEQDFMSAIEAEAKTGSFGKLSNAEVLYHMADAAEANLSYGLDLSPAELVAEAKAKIAEARSGLEEKLRGGLQGEALLQHLGQDTVNAVLRAAREQYAKKQPSLQRPAAIAQSEEQPKKRTFIRPSDVKTPFL